MDSTAALALTLLLLFLLALTYTAWVVRNEKSTFLKYQRKLKIAHFSYSVPKWWTPVPPSHPPLLPWPRPFTTHQFERRDTHYDWKTYVCWLPGAKGKEGGLASWVDQVLETNHIQLDRESFVGELGQLSFQDPEVRQRARQIRHVDGSATKNQEHRQYLDLFFFDYTDLNSSPGLLVFWMESSVLTGAVEGPYFLEALKSLKLDLR